MQGLGWIVPPLLKAYDPVGPSDPHVSPTSESERETGTTVRMLTEHGLRAEARSDMTRDARVMLPSEAACVRSTRWYSDAA